MKEGYSWTFFLPMPARTNRKGRNNEPFVHFWWRPRTNRLHEKGPSFSTSVYLPFDKAPDFVARSVFTSGKPPHGKFNGRLPDCDRKSWNAISCRISAGYLPLGGSRVRPPCVDPMLGTPMSISSRVFAISWDLERRRIQVLFWVQAAVIFFIFTFILCLVLVFYAFYVVVHRNYL